VTKADGASAAIIIKFTGNEPIPTTESVETTEPIIDEEPELHPVLQEKKDIPVVEETHQPIESEEIHQETPLSVNRQEIGNVTEVVEESVRETIAFSFLRSKFLYIGLALLIFVLLIGAIYTTKQKQQNTVSQHSMKHKAAKKISMKSF
jgi:hypothetical protein